jgi:KDO2-lipid IV(A) lauroyltransferase
MVAELPWLWLRPDDGELARRTQWVGAEPLDEIVAARRPLVMLTPHMGSFEVSARAFVDRYGAAKPLTVLYRPPRRRPCATSRNSRAAARPRHGPRDAGRRAPDAARAEARRRRRPAARQVPPEGQASGRPSSACPPTR